jgi:hypothetical protein
MPLTREAVIRALGDVDDSLVARVIATGATPEELAEACAWIANDEPMINMGHPLAVGRVAVLVEILSQVEEDELSAERR